MDTNKNLQIFVINNTSGRKFVCPVNEMHPILVTRLSDPFVAFECRGRYYVRWGDFGKEHHRQITTRSTTIVYKGETYEVGLETMDHYYC